jgi:hypothetical protein
MKSRRERWVEPAHKEEMKNTQKIIVRKTEGRDYLGYLHMDGRIILKCILNI